jgi:hypothetical protein
MRNGLRAGLASSLAALSLIAASSPAAASETIGRLAPAPVVSCTGSTTDQLEPTVTMGTGYVVPALPPASALVISSWSHNAAPAPASGALTFKIFRKVADPATYRVVSHDGPRDLTPGTLNTFPVNIPVQTGDVIGINSAMPASTACSFFDATENPLIRAGNLGDNESADFMTGSEKDINVSAVVSPSNSFAFSYPKYKKKTGIAKLPVSVPNPGELAVSGKGVRSAGAGSAMSVSASGSVRLTVRAQGAKRKKLRRTGKVSVNVAITYTPTGGDPNTRSLKLQLKLA